MSFTLKGRYIWLFPGSVHISGWGDFTAVIIMNRTPKSRSWVNRINFKVLLGDQVRTKMLGCGHVCGNSPDVCTGTRRGSQCQARAPVLFPNTCASSNLPLCLYFCMGWNERSHSSRCHGLFHLPGARLAAFQIEEASPPLQAHTTCQLSGQSALLAPAAGQPVTGVKAQEHWGLVEPARRPSVSSKGPRSPWSSCTNRELQGQPRPQEVCVLKRLEALTRTCWAQLWFFFIIFLLNLQWESISIFWKGAALEHQWGRHWCWNAVVFKSQHTSADTWNVCFLFVCLF